MHSLQKKSIQYELLISRAFSSMICSCRRGCYIKNIRNPTEEYTAQTQTSPQACCVHLSHMVLIFKGPYQTNRSCIIHIFAAQVLDLYFRSFFTIADSFWFPFISANLFNLLELCNPSLNKLGLILLRCVLLYGNAS